MSSVNAAVRETIMERQVHFAFCDCFCECTNKYTARSAGPLTALTKHPRRWSGRCCLKSGTPPGPMAEGRGRCIH